MARAARSREIEDEDESVVRQAAVAVGAVVARNPAVTGGATAFLVALSFVSANALWYQPHFHKTAFFMTRDAGDRVAFAAAEDDRNSMAAPKPVVRQVERDERLAAVQTSLAELGLYAGPIDGLSGPATRSAIEAFQSSKGLAVNGLADGRLLDMLGVERPTAAVTSVDPIPQRRPTSEDAGAEPAGESESVTRIRRVQAGLKAFGNEGIDIDGVAGAKTRSAIREFQTLFGLPVTGEPDEPLYAKMREIGLTN